jgi:uncharacterized protein YjdB
MNKYSHYQHLKLASLTIFAFLIFSCKKESTGISPTNITLSCSSIYLVVGNSDSLKYTISPVNTTDPKVIWSSSDSTIAKVSSTGNVSSIATGNVKITVTTADGNKTATCNVIVVKLINYTSFNSETGICVF